MSKEAENFKNQLSIVKPLFGLVPLTLERLFQNKLGDYNRREYKKDIVSIERVKLPKAEAEILTPKVIQHDVIILYIHGGGFCVGDIDYARGFATTLSVTQKCKTMSVAYRLAPDHKYPAALFDVYDAYKYLVSIGYDEKDIILCGESAGAGLCYSLCLKLKMDKDRLPLSIIAISPWVDLTLKHKSYIKNKKLDPSLTKDKLEKYAKCYTDDPKNMLVSPALTSRYRDMPSTLIIVSSNEILLDDAVTMHNRYIASGSDSTLIVTPNMWHAYLVNDVPEARRDLKEIEKYIKEVILGKEKTKVAKA